MLDVLAGMPLPWIASEGPFIIVLSGVVFRLAQRVSKPQSWRFASDYPTAVVRRFARCPVNTGAFATPSPALTKGPTMPLSHRIVLSLSIRHRSTGTCRYQFL